MFKKFIKGLLNTLFGVLIVGFIALVLTYAVGLKSYVVMSGSMEPDIKTGSLVFVDTKYEYEDVVEKDVIAFKTKGDTLITHRVVSVGEDYLQTKGDNNKDLDESVVNEENFVGITRFDIPLLGYLFNCLQTPKGIVIALTVIISSVILETILSDDEEDAVEEDENIEEELVEE